MLRQGTCRCKGCAGSSSSRRPQIEIKAKRVALLTQSALAARCLLSSVGLKPAGAPRDVLLQIASVHAALHQVNKLVLRSHVETCVAEAMASGEAAERRQKLDESMEVFARYCWLRGASR
jgi:hypothetical protein